MNLLSILILSVLFFLAYWIVGGIIFAIRGLASSASMRRAMFSSLFTLLSLLLAILSGIVATVSANRLVTSCPIDAPTNLDLLSQTIACSSKAYMVVGLAGFVLTIVLGSILFSLSRAKPKRNRKSRRFARRFV